MDPMTESRFRRLRDRPSGPATLISEGCRIVGLISGNGDFLVNGEVEGECNLGGTLTLARKGVWNGTIRAQDVVVAGHVGGDIEARGRVEITDTARITGTVTAEAIAVAEGAVVEGVMKTTGQSDPLEFVEKRRQDE
jgi:cytoskeletal protein CcmA (bactofilin family)